MKRGWPVEEEPRRSPARALLRSHDDDTYSLRLSGFEREDLDRLKGRVAMTWDRDDGVWIIWSRRDANKAIDVLEGLGFKVALR